MGCCFRVEVGVGKSKRKEVMKNVEMKVDGKKLTITIDLTKEFGKSSSGKTTIVATTAGNVSIPGHEDIKIGVNCYK